MPSQYRSTDSLVFGGGLKVKRKVFGHRKTPEELWEIVRNYVLRHGRHKLLRIADQIRTLERSQQQYTQSESGLQLPRYILESNINLYESSADDYNFKDEFTRVYQVDKRLFYECAIHTALLPFPFDGAGEEEPEGSISDLTTIAPKKPAAAAEPVAAVAAVAAVPDEPEDDPKKKKKGGFFGFGKKKDKEDKKDDKKKAGKADDKAAQKQQAQQPAEQQQPAAAAAEVPSKDFEKYDSTMTDIPFDLSEEVLKTRVTGGVIADFKRRAKAVLAQLQKRTKMYPEEELLGKCLGTFYDNVLEKSGKRLVGRRIYDIVRIFMKTVKEHISDRDKPKNIEAKERFCWQYFEKMVREVTDGQSTMERTASETMVWAQESKLDASGLLEWLKTVMSWNANEHRMAVDRHTNHALGMSVASLKQRLQDLSTDVTNASRYSNEHEFRAWLEAEQAKLKELLGMFVTAHAKQPKNLVHITANRPTAELFLAINGTVAFKTEDGWRLGLGDSVTFSMWNDKDAVGKEKSDKFLGTRSIKFTGNPETIKFDKGVEIVVSPERQPELDMDLDHEMAYFMLLDKCLEIDTAYGMGQNGEYSLSRLSDALLYIYALRWGVSDASRFVAQVELLLPKYAAHTITLFPLYLAFSSVAEAESANALIFSRSEKERWLRVLTSMEGIFRYNVTGYRQAYPYNQPENELDQTLYMLRVIYDNPLFRSSRPDVKPWSAELYTMIQVGAVQRFQLLHALANPVVSNMYGRILEMVKLLLEELTTEKSYFSKSWKRYHLDNVQISLEVYLKYLALEMDYISQMGRKCWKQRRALPSPLVFTLYDMMKVVTEKVSPYNQLADYIEISRWFSPFVFLFLDMTSIKSTDIVNNAIKLDDFTPISETVLHSSSILDVFSFFHQTLDWLKKLAWPDKVYVAKFMGRLGAVYCQSIDLYAEQLRAKIDATLDQPEISEDDKRRMCVQINNIETARSQLNDLHVVMEIESLQQVLLEFAGTAPDTPTDAVLPALEHGVGGTFEIKLSPQFLMQPRVYGLAASGYFALVHPTTGAVLGRTMPGQTVDIAINPPAEALVIELHFSNALGDVVVAKTFIQLDEAIEDHDTHEFHPELLAVGKVMVRLKKMGERANDIEFAFRKSFRSLKRTVQDTLFTRLIVPLIMTESSRLIEQYDRKFVKEPYVGTVYRSDQNLLITDEVIGQELNTTFDVLGDTLGFLSNHLYEDVLKLFIRRLWRDVCVAMEVQVLLSPLRYLTVKQLTVMVNVVETFKLFLFGDGELVALKHLDETAEYKRLLRLIEMYPLPTAELIDRYEEYAAKANSSMGAEVLAILKLRAGPDELNFVAKQEQAKWMKIRGGAGGDELTAAGKGGPSV
ncbi:hypothetical protein H9P43_000731 [Blastocladiella emersonii ATCC 22665]|nr:hypothetical protein H9P43_000731 [Blastocladiella emersonii ATCC 22665]